MSVIWVLFLLLSVVTALQGGTASGLSAAAMTGAGSGVTLAVQLAGPLALWAGLSQVMESCGWSSGLARALAPLLRRLFPRAWDDPAARDALCGNLSANLLGLGNAATPLGIQAVRRMALGQNGTASDELCRLVVMNTASIQLIPATVASVRAGLGAAAPFDILPAVWITSVCSVTAGLLAARLLSRWL